MGKENQEARLYFHILLIFPQLPNFVNAIGYLWHYYHLNMHLICRNLYYF